MSRRTIDPHRLLCAPHRLSAFGGTLLGLGILPALLSSCRTAPTATRPPITWPSPHPSATNEPTATPKPWPTKTPLPTIDASAPLPVAMTLDQARAEVLSWLDPAHTPRIVSADYIPAAALATGRTVSGAKRIDDLFSGFLDDQVVVTSPTMVRVIASYTRPDAPLLELPLGFFSNGWPFSGMAPSRLLALFDASTGARLSALPLDTYATTDLGASALAAPTAAITVTVAMPLPTPARQGPTWAPTSPPTPAPTPIGPPVDADNVPPAMRSVLTAYPLLPGSTWTWETTDWVGGVRLERSWTTETVLGAWRLDDTRLAVRTRVERRQTYRPAASSTELVLEQEGWRTVTADGVVAPYSSKPKESTSLDYLAQGTATDAPRLGLPIESLHSSKGHLEWSFPEAITTTRIAVTTPAGQFEGCGVFEVMGGASFASLRAICPGVGYVETDTWYGGSLGFGLSVTQLVRYHVVLPR